MGRYTFIRMSLAEQGFHGNDNDNNKNHLTFIIYKFDIIIYTKSRKANYELVWSLQLR